jgi:hypothetical protein
MDSVQYGMVVLLLTILVLTIINVTKKTVTCSSSTDAGVYSSPGLLVAPDTSSGKPLAITYHETWTGGMSNTYAAVQASGSELTTTPYAGFDVVILAFGTMQFYGAGNTILIGGLNGTGSNYETASRTWDTRRLKTKVTATASLLTNFVAGTETGTPLEDPFSGVSGLNTYISGLKASSTLTSPSAMRVWVSFGGENGSNAATFAAMTAQNLTDMFLTYPGIDGIDLDIENPQIDPAVFLSQCKMISSVCKTNSKTLCLCIETTQAIARLASQYAAVWKNAPATIFDYVSLQYYNACYPYNLADTTGLGDIYQLMQYGFNSNQIILGANPGRDKCGPTPDLAWIIDTGPGKNFAQMCAYARTASLGGMFLWATQRDSYQGNGGDNVGVTTAGLEFDFNREPQDGLTPTLPWNAPWPAAYTNVTPACSVPQTSGNFASAMLTALRA